MTQEVSTCETKGNQVEKKTFLHLARQKKAGQGKNNIPHGRQLASLICLILLGLQLVDLSFLKQYQSQWTTFISENQNRTTSINLASLLAGAGSNEQPPKTAQETTENHFDFDPWLDKFPSQLCQNKTSQRTEQFCLFCLVDDDGWDETRTCINSAFNSIRGYGFNAILALQTVANTFPNCCKPPVDYYANLRRMISSLSKINTTDQQQPMAWCLLGGNNTPPSDYLGAFAHPVQALMPCWSFFSRIQEINDNNPGQSQYTRGIWFHQYQAESFRSLIESERKYGRPSWIGEFLKTWNCQYHYGEDKPFLGTENDLFYRPHNPEPFNAYYQKPTDARRLQQQIFSQEDLLYDDPRKLLRIGLVQRQGTARHITNLKAIQEKIVQYYSNHPIHENVVVEWGEMEGMAFYDQAAFWHRQHVVVAAHGAAMTNAMFMQPLERSAVVEVFPPHYYILMYRKLARTMQVHHFPHLGVPMNSSTNEDDDNMHQKFPEFDLASHASTRRARYALRGNPLTPPVEDILSLVHEAVQAVVKSTTKR